MSFFLLNPIGEEDRTTYRDADIRAYATKTIPLAGGGLLAVHQRDHDAVLHFAVYAFETGEATDDGKEITTEWRVIFSGHGMLDMRELRHTWWGTVDGYIFYPQAKVITDAFVKLQEWFDCD